MTSTGYLRWVGTGTSRVDADGAGVDPGARSEGERGQVRDVDGLAVVEQLGHTVVDLRHVDAGGERPEAGEQVVRRAPVERHDRAEVDRPGRRHRLDEGRGVDGGRVLQLLG